MPYRMKKFSLKNFLLNALFLIFTLSCLFPVVWIFYSSLKTKDEFVTNIVNLPQNPSFQNYIDVFQTTPMLTFVANSLRNTVLSLVIIVFFSFVTGYFIARFDFFGKKVIYVLYLFSMVVPIHALLVPVYLIFNQAHLIDRWFTLIIPNVAFGLAFPIFLIESYIGGIPREMEEAAAIDGCSFNRTLFTIIMPLAFPAIATVAIIQFFSCWNEFAFALILTQKESLRTLPIALTYFQAQHDVNYPRMMAAMCVSLIPVAAVYFSFSSQIIKGVAAGAVKG